MKTKLLLSALFTFSFLLSPCLAQVPQGFNYQAIARDGSGNPITNATIKVKLSILSDTTGFYSSGSGTYLWEEEQTNVKTNAFGLFTVVFGNTSATKVQGSAASFSAIDWAKTPLYIGTKIANPTTFKIMGSAKLWSVPYSMVSSGLSGTLKKLGVTGVTTSPDSALFEVKNRNGQTVFAVYNEGVRVYVDDGIGKSSTKGGFAIGGFGTVKSPSQEFFRVTRDSTRIYLNNALGKSTKGGFAIGGFDVVKGVNRNLLTVSDDSVRVYIDTNPVKSVTKGGFAIGGFDQVKAKSQEYLRVTSDSTRVYINNQSGKGATKGGFAIGGFDQVKGGTQDLLTVSNDSIRMYINDISGKGVTKGGFAIGGFDQVKGVRANFLNVATEATGIVNPSQNRILWYPIKNAFLAGKVLIEDKDSVGENSFASGYESKAKGNYSQALGYKAKARGNYSTAIGKNAIADSINSFAFGDSAQAKNVESYAFGRKARAEGFRSYAFGSYGFDPTGRTEFADSITRAIGDYSIAFGQGSISYGFGSLSIGMSAHANSGGSVALGGSAVANGYPAIAIGASQANGNFSLSMGTGAKALGAYSIAIGYFPISGGYGSVALGNSIEAYGENAFATGWGTNAKGRRSTAMGFFTMASGDYSVALGYQTKSNSYACTVLGRNNDTTSISSSTWQSSDPLFIVGNGPAYNNRTNAFTVYKNGNAFIQGNLGIGINPGTAKLSISGLTGSATGSTLLISGNNVYYLTSKRSSKNNILPLSDDFNKILGVQPVSFNDKITGMKGIGYIAEDFEKEGLQNLLVYEDGKLVSLRYDLISVYNLEIIKEQQKSIIEQKDQIESVKQENQQLRSELDELKVLVNALVSNQVSKGNN